MNILLPVAATVPMGEPALGAGTALLLALLLVGVNGFFVAAEFALAKVRPTQIEPYVLRGDRRGKTAAHMLSHLDAYLSATQLGITLASLALGWVGEPAFVWLLDPLLQRLPGITPAVVHSVALTTAFVTISALHIVLGELVPKSLAIRRPEGVSLWVAMPLTGFYWLMFPAIWLLNHTANLLLRLVGLKPATESELAHSEEEVRLLLGSSESSHLSDAKRDLLTNVFELSDRVARQVMLPRADVVFLSTTRTVAENLEIARRSGHTRFPLCDGDLDHPLGLVHIKDLFRAGKAPADLAEVKRPLPFVPETQTLDRLLTRMLDERVHLVAVVDEYGGVSGIVTLENVLEEIVGQIQDEFDHEKPELTRREEGGYLVSGAMLVVDLEDELGLEFSPRDEDTIAGVVLSELGRPPQVGDTVEVGPLRLEVVELDRNRIRLLRLEVVPEGERADGDGD